MTETSKNSETSKRTRSWWSKNWFYITLVLVAVIGGGCAFTLPYHFQREGDNIWSLRQAILAATGGVLAILTLWENRRKNIQEKEKNDQDHTRQVHAERRARYAKAVEQLAEEKAPIRLGGVYTLVKLVDEWLADEKTLPNEEERREEGQVIINSLCAYIRSPFDLASRVKVLSQDQTPENYEGGDQQLIKDQARFREEKELRLTILDAIKTRLNSGTIAQEDGTEKPIKGPWSDFDYDFSNAHFFCPVDFANSYFGASSNFSRVELTADADFSGAKFTGSTSFVEAEFTADSNFVRVEFTGGANFSEAKFTGSTSFVEAEFTADSSFVGAEFTNYADFFRAKFTADTDFSEAKFTEYANFVGAKFTEYANFSGAEFTKNANFSVAEFTEYANFSGAEFTEYANFFEAVFAYYANFSGAEFTKNANFFKAEFAYYANFSMAIDEHLPIYRETGGFDFPYPAKFSCKADSKDYNFEVSHNSPYKIETEEKEYDGVKFIIPKDAELFDPDEPSE